jgi:hypothetical protein
MAGTVKLVVKLPATSVTVEVRAIAAPLNLAVMVVPAAKPLPVAVTVVPATP